MEIEWTDENSFLCIIDQPKVEKSGFSKIPSFRISTKVVKPHPFLKVCLLSILMFMIPTYDLIN